MSSGRCYTRRMSTSRYIPATHTLRAVLDLSPVSGRETSRVLGHSESWARLAARPAHTPRLDTLADVAGIAGLDVALIDRSTGDVVAVVEPPTPAARQGASGAVSSEAGFQEGVRRPDGSKEVGA